MLPEINTKNYKSQTTTNTYADLGDSFDTRFLNKETLYIKNTGGANGAKYKVLGSLDDVHFDVEIIAEQTLAAGIDAKHSNTDYYRKIKIQIKAAVADSQTTVVAKFAGRN